MRRIRRLAGSLTLLVALVAGLGIGGVEGLQQAAAAPARASSPGRIQVSAARDVPALSAGPKAGPVEAQASGPLSLDLYRNGDFVSQTNLVQCVGASMQMMLNIIGPTNDRTAATQQLLWNLARTLRDPSSPANPSWRGASAGGWANGLTSLGAGPYEVMTAPTLAAALSLAAAAMTSTGKPVGLLMWQGAHAWVMSGFEATGDPALDPTARVTAVRVLDPLYPRIVGAPWGPGPAPDARLTVAQLQRVFVPYRPHSRNLALRNQFVIVAPYVPVRTAASRMRAI